MNTEEAKKWVTDEVIKYQKATGRKKYLSKSDFYFFTGALAFCSDTISQLDIIKGIQEKLEADDGREYNREY